MKYKMVFRAHVEKDQPPMYRTIWVPRKGGAPYDAADGCPKGNDGVNSDSDRIGLCVPGPSGVHILAEFPGRSFFYVPPLPRQKFKVPHELPFCGMVAGQLGDWLRV